MSDMLSNGIINTKMEPVARWENPDEGVELDSTVLRERLRFPYASNVAASNRIMKSAMSEQLATYDENDMVKSGIPTRDLINLYEKFADGGFGTIVTGCIMVNGKDIEAAGNVIIDKELDSEERRAAFREWTECAKRNGSIFIAQLFHPGKYAADLPHKTDFDINKLTRKQIGELVNDYAYAAHYAQQCGFNGVEISCAYFFALGELITSGANTRTDEFGGELDSRAKILFKIIQAIRMKISRPSRFVIGLKLFCGNFEPGFKDDVFGEFVHSVEKTGFDYITITGGHYNLIRDLKRSDDPKKCEYFYQQFVLNIKNHLTRTKLFMNGGFVTLSDMVAAVRDGWAAGVSLGRPVAAEPDLPKRMYAGEVKSAVKSLIDPLDFSVAQQFAGSQLWQHGNLLTVMDASNPDHVEQFKKDLHFHEKQKSAVSEGGGGMAFGYPKTILNPELLDEEVLKKIQPSSVSMEAVTEEGHPAKTEHEPAVATIDDAQNELMEEETHHVVKKQLDNAALGDLQENIVEDTIHTVVKRHENLDDGGVEIIEETIEKVRRTQADYSVPPLEDYSDAAQQQQQQQQQQEFESTDVIKHDGTSAEVIEAVEGGFHDTTKSTLETAFDKSTELVDEVVNDVADGLRKEDEEARAVADVVAEHEKEHEEKMLSEEPQNNEAVVEVISGLSSDDKPVISGIVEDVSHQAQHVENGAESAVEDIIKPQEHTEEFEHEREQKHELGKLETENQESTKVSLEPPIGSENYFVDENAVEAVTDKATYGSAKSEMKMTVSELASKSEQLLSEKDDEHFSDASKFRDAEAHNGISKDVSAAPEGITEVYTPEGMTESHVLEGVTADRVSESVAEGHVSEGAMESPVPDGIIEGHAREHVREDHVPEDVMETFVSDGITETHVPEGVMEGHVSERVVEDHVSESAAEGHVTEGVMETPVVEGITESHAQEHVIDDHVSQDVMEGHVSDGTAEGHVSEGVMEGHVSKGITKDHFSKSADEGYKPEGVMVNHVTEGTTEGHVPEDVMEGHLPEGIMKGHVSKSVAEGHMPEGVMENHVSEGTTEGHLPESMIEGHVSEGVKEDHVSQNVMEGHVPESVLEGHTAEGVTEDRVAGSITEALISGEVHENHVSEGMTGDRMPENHDEILKSDHSLEDHVADSVTGEQLQGSHHPEGVANVHVEGAFREDEFIPQGLNEMSGGVDQYKVSSATYSTLFGSSLPEESGSTVVHEEHYEKHSTPGHPSEQIFHSKVYEIPGSDLKDEASVEHSPNKHIDASQSETEFRPEEPVTDISTSEEKAQGHGLAGFISSALPDSVQNLISSTRGKFDEIFSESEGKQQPQQSQTQFTEKTEEATGDGRREYEAHTESYAITGSEHGSPSDFASAAAAAVLAADFEKLKATEDFDDDAVAHHSSETTATTTTSVSEEYKKHQGGLFGDKKSNDELDFEFVH